MKRLAPELRSKRGSILLQNCQPCRLVGLFSWVLHGEEKGQGRQMLIALGAGIVITIIGVGLYVCIELVRAREFW